jgi:hypothetical protein
MKLGKQFDINILANAVLDWPQLSGSAALGTNHNFNDENIKSTNSFSGTNTKSTNLWIYELVIFNQTTKIDAHEEKDFHSILFHWTFHERGHFCLP